MTIWLRLWRMIARRPCTDLQERSSDRHIETGLEIKDTTCHGGPVLERPIDRGGNAARRTNSSRSRAVGSDPANHVHRMISPMVRRVGDSPGVTTSRQRQVPLRSGIMLGHSAVLTNRDADTKGLGNRVLAEWHAQHPDSGVHSVQVGHCGRGDRPPPRFERQDGLREGFNWRVTKMGLTLLRIPAGHVRAALDRVGQDPGKTIRIEKDFWLSDREVTWVSSTVSDDKDAEKPMKFDEIRNSTPAIHRCPWSTSSGTTR